ncbi:MAG: hypothetical protein NTX87_05290 [Planctomycetota bacterium]|nr:hypothetical protein [Planctomycetota bacterium]
MPNGDYVQMPQDDMAQIEQVGREYGSEPAKGLAHGVQKDAIQNGFGARAEVREVEACRTWSMTFELKQIGGKDALVFWDEGTLGLTGDILTSDQIIERFAAQTLGPDQRLGRFLARFVSGGNVGAGSFGRGKLIFHAASTTTNILVDSLRAPDCLYVALDRKVEGGTLLQPRTPYVGDAAKEFILRKTGGVLTPLAMPGTRIAILDAKPAIVEAFQQSFSESPSIYAASFAHMIEETWWEILHRFDAKIYLRHGDKALRVGLHDPMETIAEAEDNQEGVRVHSRINIPLTAGQQPYRIKEVRLVVMPSNVDEEFRDIWIQRKRMKIGSIARGIDAHARIAKRLAGYVVLEPSLEALVEQSEGTTHYAFHLGGSGVRQIRDTVRAELRDFERRLGLVSASEDAESRRRLLDSMKELNELAAELGLLTQQNVGVDQSDIDILLREMRLPQENSLRIEIADHVGPIKYRLVNKAARAWAGTFRVKARQQGREETELFSQQVSLDPEAELDVEVPAFEVSRDRFENGKPVRVEAVFVKADSTEVVARCGRTLYIGTDPPTTEKPPVTLHAGCRLPRSDTRRVEMSDVIRSIRFKVTNNSAFALNIDLAASVRHLTNPKTGRLTTPLFELLSQADFVIGPQQDHEVFVDDIVISPERFGSVHQTLADVSERACDIFAVVRLARASAELNKPRKWKFPPRSIPFYLEVDPPGHSIFQDLAYADEPTNGRQSWHEGTLESGYKFILNAGHSAYKFAKGRDDASVVKRYEQEQMLRHAYLIAFENDVYKGPAEQFRDDFSNGHLSAKEIAEKFDTIIGTALNQMQG